MADEVLVATGRRPCSTCTTWRPPASSSTTGAGRSWARRSARPPTDIWAAGDATGELLFTHVGAYEADIVVDDILGRPRARDYRVVPRVTFCDPEVASVGLTEREAPGTGHEVGRRCRRDRRQRASAHRGQRDGLVKLVADARTGELLGGHIVGERPAR